MFDKIIAFSIGNKAVIGAMTLALVAWGYTLAGAALQRLEVLPHVVLMAMPSRVTVLGSGLEPVAFLDVVEARLNTKPDAALVDPTKLKN